MEKEGAEGDDVSEEAAEVTDQEMSFMPLRAEPTDERQQPDMGLVVLRWIRLLVCHITALETLSLFFRHKAVGDKKVKIQVVALRPTPMEQTPWKTVVSRALSSSPSLVDRHDDVIHALVTHIQDRNTHAKDYQFTSRFLSDQVQVSGVVHCEVALACLLKFSPLATPVKTALHLDVPFSLFLLYAMF
jgi:hypothetical protein